MSKNRPTVSLTIAVALSVILVPLNTTMVAMALSPIRGHFDVSVGWVAWLISAYLIFMAVSQSTAGRLGDLLGRRRIFLMGLVYFGLASLMATTAWNFPLLVFFRAQQAVGGAMVMSNGLGTLRSRLPQNIRGRIFGLLAASMASAMIVGPLLGGVLAESIGWRAIFAINVPMVCMALSFAWKFFPKDVVNKSRETIDVFGIFLLAVILSSFVIATTLSSQNTLAYSILIVLATVPVASFLMFVWWERRQISPIIPLSIFRRRSFSAANATVFLFELDIYALLIVIPLFLQELKLFGTSQSGFLLLPLAVLIVVVAPLSGLFSDRVGRNIAAVVGSLFLILGLISLTTWTTSSSVVQITLSLALFGLGFGVIDTPTQTAALEACPEGMAGVAYGTNSTIRYCGGIVGSVLVGALLANGEMIEFQAFHTLMIILTSISAALVLSSAFIHRRA